MQVGGYTNVLKSVANVLLGAKSLWNGDADVLKSVAGK
jgi:hypothetical protein